MSNTLRLSVFALLAISSPVIADSPAGLSKEGRAQIDRDVKDLGERIEALRKAAKEQRQFTTKSLYPDAEIFRKAVMWALRFEPKLEPADVALVQKALKRCRERVESLEAGKSPWSPDRIGKTVRGFVSDIDGSVQLYGLVVPKQYAPRTIGMKDDASRMRLDIVLHGSTRPTGMAELRFLLRFDEGDGASTSAPDQHFVELHPLGRVENCYRWAGETDVFEARSHIIDEYHVNWRMPVLRGMSMGASGTWHLGLKHPTSFAALGPYCGYVDTHEFSKTAMPNFVKVGPLPPHQEAGLHMLDSIDYAANAGMIPTIAGMGEKDPFFQAHALMGKAMEKEGLTMVNLISPGTGHVIDPVTHKEQMRRIAEIVAKGSPAVPKHVRFVTWTLKYNRCEWLSINALEEHYKRAELDATLRVDGIVEIKEPTNIELFTIGSDALEGMSKVRIGKAEFPLAERPAEPAAYRFLKRNGQWLAQRVPPLNHNLNVIAADFLEQHTGKEPGLQGPIDDAFTHRFLCVRGTGTAWNPAVQAWADASLKRFAEEWAKYFRGDLPVKGDKDVTPQDIEYSNLILFGDPGSNSLIARVLPNLPISWTKDELTVWDKKYPATNHAPVLIQPNRLPGVLNKYVVINSGHTFHERELSTLNYLLFPRLGDWSVMKIGDPPADVWKEDPVRAGYFDERWLFPGQKPDFDLKDGDTVAFLGDSITAARTYGKIVENYTLLRFPTRKVRFINVGKGGDTAAGGLARLDDVLAQKPTVLIVAYGTNDIGWGVKADDEHKKAYLDGIRGIVEKARAQKVRVYVCSAAVTAADPTKSEDSYLQKMCDEGMALARSLSEHSIDVQRSMREVQKRIAAFNEKVKGEKSTMHAADGVHLNELGQLAMAYAILKGLNAPAEVSSMEIIVDRIPRVWCEGCWEELANWEDGQLSFTRLDRGLPFNYGLFFGLNYRFVPVHDELNRYMLKVEKLPEGKYEITADGRGLGTFTSQQLARGVNLASATSNGWEPGGPWDAQAWALKSLTDARHELALGGMMAKAYLPDRLPRELAPGMVKTDEELVALQRLTAKPHPYKFVVKPVK
ncbi:MAG TPA: GDSL-type esterase/lipase family protein [Gemmataceae bacterium]|nr:GDSL-type esterase/lipase family protein [Gemmataceae bacterium]